MLYTSLQRALHGAPSHKRLSKPPSMSCSPRGAPTQRRHAPHSRQPAPRAADGEHPLSTTEQHANSRKVHEWQGLPAAVATQTAALRVAGSGTDLKAGGPPHVAQEGDQLWVKRVVPGHQQRGGGLLSFEGELEEEGAEAANAATLLPDMAASTAKRFKSERAPRLLPPPDPSRGWQAPPQGAAQLGRTGLLKVCGRICFGAAQARGARPYMEDRHVLIPNFQALGAGGPLQADGHQRAYAAVFDGHNGANAAEVCAARMHQLLASDPALRAPPKEFTAAKVGGALERAFAGVEEEVLAHCSEHGTREGSTALVLLRLGGSLYTAHAGDSRAVLCRQGKALRLTQDHKPDLLTERERIERAGGRIHFQSNCWRVMFEATPERLGCGLAVSRAIGDPDFKTAPRLVESKPEVEEHELAAGDSFVVLASDGLWDVMSDEVAVDIAASAMAKVLGERQTAHSGDVAAKAAADALLEQALKAHTLDNVTVVVCALHWD